MEQHGLDDNALRSIGEELLGLLARGNPPPVHASADGLASIVMNAHFELSSLTLERVDLGLEEKARLEQALITAINDAIRKVARNHEERFRAITEP